MDRSTTAITAAVALLLIVCSALMLRIDYKIESRLAAIEQRLTAIESNLALLDRRVSYLELHVLGSAAQSSKSGLGAHLQISTVNDSTITF